MAEYTEHYNLKKPLKSENYDVDVANTNNDIIDEKIFGKVDKIVGKSLSSNDFTDGYKQKVDKLIEGTKGDSAYQVALKNGFEGTETQWLASLKGDKGDTGDVSKEELKEVTENKRLKIEGKSEQEVSITGKNICPDKWELGQYSDSTGEKIEGENRIRVSYLVPCKPNTNYYVNMFASSYDIKFIIRGYNSSKVFNANHSAINNDSIFSTKTDEYYLGITIYDVKSTTSDLLNLIKTGILKPFICLHSETDKTYTDFIPTMPSPDYPGRIRNIGDNVNLAEYVEGLWINGVSLKFTNSENTYGFIAKVKPNTQYIINKKYAGNRFIVVSSSIYPQKDADIVRNIFTSNYNLTQYTFTTQSNEKYIFLGVYYKTDFETEEEELKKAISEVKIEESSIATPYTEYGCGSIDYLGQNKNLGYVEYYNKTRGYKNGNLTDNNSYNTYKAIVEGNTQYTISFEGTEDLVSNLCYFDINMKYIKGDPFNTGNPRILTTPENCKYITLAVNHNVTNFMIEKGKINTDFIEHQEKNIHIPLNKGQIIHKDDYIMNNEIHQNRKTVTLTGNETITRRGYVDSTNKTYRYSIELEGRDTSSRTNLICSHLPVDDQYSQNKSLIFGGGSNEGNIVYFQFVLDEIGVTDVTKISDYLKSQYENGTPVIVEYKLAEEIVTPLTKKQIEAFYELQKTKYVDKMTLTCLNEIEPTLTDIDKSLEESLLDVEKLLAMLSLNS